MLSSSRKEGGPCRNELAKIVSGRILSETCQAVLCRAHDAVSLRAVK